MFASSDYEDVLRGSLFDPELATPPCYQPHSGAELLAVREEFAGWWFTYEYNVAGPERAKEECSYVLRLGWSEATVCSDVAHRASHFYDVYSKSWESSPSFTEGGYLTLSLSRARVRARVCARACVCVCVRCDRGLQ